MACPASPETADEAALRSANAAEVTASLTDDAPALETLRADSFVVTNPQGHFITKSEVIKMARSGALCFAPYERQVGYERQYGDIAIVAGTEAVALAAKTSVAG